MRAEFPWPPPGWMETAGSVCIVLGIVVAFLGLVVLCVERPTWPAWIPGLAFTALIAGVVVSAVGLLGLGAYYLLGGC